MLWIKAFHLIAIVTWFASLFYLPRLFVYHADTTDLLGQERFKIMERRLLKMAHLGAGLSLGFGIWLVVGWRSDLLANGGWFHAKMALVLALLAYHHVCARFVTRFRLNQNAHSARYYRVFNEIPALLLVGIVILAVVKPF
jgi:putative membrane protein